MDPAASALGTLASHGILGAICVILLVVAWKLYSHLQESNKSRVEDAQKMIEVMMFIQKEHTTTISTMTAVIGSLKESVDRLEARSPASRRSSRVTRPR